MAANDASCATLSPEHRYRFPMHDSEVAASIESDRSGELAEAYDRYADPLYKYCLALLGDPAEAVDAVQDTFVIAAALPPWLGAGRKSGTTARLAVNGGLPGRGSQLFMAALSRLPSRHARCSAHLSAHYSGQTSCRFAEAARPEPRKRALCRDMMTRRHP
jgi:hypothetical protein